MLESYLSELDKIELLSVEEERRLWEAYRVEDDESARTALIEHYQPLVFREAMNYRNAVPDVMDCVQEGTVGLIESVERFDYTKGVAFSLYAVHRIRGRILDYLRKEGKGGVLWSGSAEEEEDWWEQLPDEGPSIENRVEEEAFNMVVNEAIERLPSNERHVMKQVYLADRSIASVAGELCTSNSYIHRLHRQGIKRLRGMLSRTRKIWQE
ncbi:MAG: sigma-70 family RNA polymerase sigma factor [Veillonella sp.]|uniref:sigma-70 family RNA polymerase sigma factor n=1 Tax=Veillonella sp. TaxID=1926307 RepID=UPI0025EA62A6|nr:sigma-70 family RNA polymerase sigma factor [Veillonella sp.]MBS4913575.1 sigma-70 family RNA polymerase sigma factor [Veillonella sp.]